MSQRNILVIGSANIDLVTQVPHIPRPGESLIGSSFATITGGKGANQAVAAARLGARVTFAGCVGNDAFGEMQRASLSAEGIDLGYLKSHPSTPTGTAIITVAEDGQNSIVVTPGANYAFTPGDVEALMPAMQAADVVRESLDNFRPGKLYVVPDWRYRWFVHLYPKIPTSLRLWLAARSPHKRK